MKRLLSFLLVLTMCVSMVTVGFTVQAAETSLAPFTKWTETEWTAANAAPTPISHLAVITADDTDPNYGNYAVIGQEFVPATPVMDGIKLAFLLTGGNAQLTVELREEINGTAFYTENFAIVGDNTLKWYTCNFATPQKVTVGKAYYVVYYYAQRDEGNVSLNMISMTGKEQPHSQYARVLNQSQMSKNGTFVAPFEVIGSFPASLDAAKAVLEAFPYDENTVFGTGDVLTAKPADVQAALDACKTAVDAYAADNEGSTAGLDADLLAKVDAVRAALEEYTANPYIIPESILLANADIGKGWATETAQADISVSKDDKTEGEGATKFTIKEGMNQWFAYYDFVSGDLGAPADFTNVKSIAFDLKTNHNRTFYNIGSGGDGRINISANASWDGCGVEAPFNTLAGKVVPDQWNTLVTDVNYSGANANWNIKNVTKTRMYFIAPPAEAISGKYFIIDNYRALYNANYVVNNFVKIVSEMDPTKFDQFILNYNAAKKLYAGFVAANGADAVADATALIPTLDAKYAVANDYKNMPPVAPDDAFVTASDAIDAIDYNAEDGINADNYKDVIAAYNAAKVHVDAFLESYKAEYLSEENQAKLALFNEIGEKVAAFCVPFDRWTEDEWTKYNLTSTPSRVIGFEGATADNHLSFENMMYYAQGFVSAQSVISGVKLGLLYTAPEYFQIKIEVRDTADGEALHSQVYDVKGTGEFKYYNFEFNKNVTITPYDTNYIHVSCVSCPTGVALAYETADSKKVIENAPYMMRYSFKNASKGYQSQKRMLPFEITYPTTDGVAPFTKNTADNLATFYHVSLVNDTVNASTPNFADMRRVGQAFVPADDTVTGLRIPLNCIHATATMHVEIREEINGEAIAANDVAFVSKGNAMHWYTFMFDEPVGVTPGKVYYFVYYLVDKAADGGVCILYASNTGGFNPYGAYFYDEASSTKFYQAAWAIVGFEIIDSNIDVQFRPMDNVSSLPTEHGLKASSSTYKLEGAKSIAYTIKEETAAANQLAFGIYASQRLAVAAKFADAMTFDLYVPNQAFIDALNNFTGEASVSISTSTETGEWDSSAGSISKANMLAAFAELKVGWNHVVMKLDAPMSGDVAGKLYFNIQGITLTEGDAFQIDDIRFASNKFLASEANAERIAAKDVIIADMTAAAVVEDAIATLVDVTYTDAPAVAEARDAYDGLTDAQKDYVTNLDVLEAAEAAIAGFQKEIDDVIAAIDDIGEVTLDSESAIVAARTAFDTLSADQKAAVTNADALIAAETALADLKADKAAVDAVIEKIENLPAEIDLDDEADIAEAREAYDALDEDLKDDVTNYEKLVAAEAALDELKNPPIVPGDVSGDGNVSSEDALMALQASVGKLILTDEQITAADVDGVDGITASDALAILKAAVDA